MPTKTSIQKLFSILPFSFLLYLKNNLEIVKKLDYKKKDIFLYVDSSVENEFRLRSCFHEPGTVEWIEEFIKRDEVVFDVGANIGAYSLITAKYNNGKNQIYSFEPNFSSYNKLCKNIILNNCESCILAFQIALANKYSIDALNVFSFEVGSAYHTLENNKFIGEEPKYKQPVVVYSIDKFIEDFGIKSPHHIKIDVDGIEHEVLQGAKKTISNPRFRTLNIEIDENSEDCAKIIRLVKLSGMDFYKKYTDLNADDPPTSNLKIYNYIFVRS